MTRSDRLSDCLVQVDSNNPEEMRRFFLEQIQKGEDCLSRGMCPFSSGRLLTI